MLLALAPELFPQLVNCTISFAQRGCGPKARQGKGRQGKARQGKGRQGKARQGKARQGKQTIARFNGITPA
jgi:hypothetical protein